MPADLPTARLDLALRAAAARLPGPDARHEAEQLLLHVLGRDRAWLFAHGDDPLPEPEAAAFDALLTRRAAGEPLAYLLGRRGFWTLDLQVSPATLIPRPETERLVELALERLPDDRPLRIADLGTGSGAIALALASERPRAQVVATDVSDEALHVAQANAEVNRVANVAFRRGSWLAPLAAERFDLIASNPPISPTAIRTWVRATCVSSHPLRCRPVPMAWTPSARSWRPRLRTCCLAAGCCWSMAGTRARRSARC